MKIRNLGQWRGALSAMLLILSACGGLPAPESTPVINEPGVPKQLQSRQIIIALSDRLKPQWDAIASELQSQYALRPVGAFPLASIKVQCLVYQVPADQDLEKVLAQLRADPRIELVQSNQVFEGLQTAPSQSVYAGLAYGAKLMRADLVRQVSTGHGVPVAVIDTGADIDHPGLRGRVAKTATFVEGGEPSFSTDRHGTAVAGVIGARADAEVLEGVAPEAKLLVAKACWYPDPASAKARCSSWTLAKAIDFAVHENVRVINLSLGGRFDELLARLLTAAHQQGVTVVAASLEGQDNPGFPASLDTVIPVVACDAEGRVASLDWRDIDFAAAAPGVDIVVPVPDSGYALVSGSSLAAAHVTGVVALLLQQAPQLTPDQIRTVLQTTAQPAPGFAATMTPRVGLIDACAALAQLAPQLTCRSRPF